MGLKKLVKLFYIGYTLYVILVANITSLTLMDLVPGIVLMWLIYICFIIGYKTIKTNIKKKNYEPANNCWIINQKNVTLLFIGVVTIIFSIIATKYYTNQTPITVIQGIFGGGNLGENSIYTEYQNYARIHQNGLPTIKKSPFILMLFFNKFILYYSFVSFFLLKKKTNTFEKLYLFLIFSSSIYFGIARGTNFEFFEYTVLVVFIILSKPKELLKSKLKIGKFLIVFLIIGSMIYIFFEGISARGVIFNFDKTKDYTFDYKNILSIIAPSIAFTTLLIYNYFGFGFLYVSKFITSIWLTSTSNFIAGLIPFGYISSTNYSIQDLIQNHIFVGTRWNPDVIVFINILGVLGFLLLCFFLGLYAKYIFLMENSGLKFLSEFMILLQMISFPMGNFIITSSANTLIVILLLSIWFWKVFVRVRIKI